MQAVEHDNMYELIDPSTKKTVGMERAKDIFDMIVEHAWLNGEPGIVFLDRINKKNTVPELGEIESTNPCGEQPLLPY
jgi:ribonucleoside-diphosphate reductase alpha chain